MSAMRWTEADYDQMSWHDNHVHGVEIRLGDDGTGSLILHLDYILEWIVEPDRTYRWRIAPAVLTFRGVADLQMELDDLDAPFCIRSIDREEIAGQSSYRWSIGINWPEGFIAFSANGFVQELTAESVVTSQQHLQRA